MDNQQIILNQALELFAARGYDAVGVQEIVEQAGITKPTLYHYFGSKLGLLQALLSAPNDILLDELEKACAYHGDLPLTLTHITSTYFNFAASHRLFYRLQLALWLAPRDSDGFQLVEDYNRRQYRLVEAVFLQATAEHGNMRGRQRAFASTLIGMINTYISLALNNHAELNDDLVWLAVRQFQYGIYS